MAEWEDELPSDDVIGSIPRQAVETAWKQRLNRRNNISDEPVTGKLPIDHDASDRSAAAQAENMRKGGDIGR